MPFVASKTAKTCGGGRTNATKKRSGWPSGNYRGRKWPIWNLILSRAWSIDSIMSFCVHCRLRHRRKLVPKGWWKNLLFYVNKRKRMRKNQTNNSSRKWSWFRGRRKGSKKSCSGFATSLQREVNASMFRSPVVVKTVRKRRLASRLSSLCRLRLR